MAAHDRPRDLVPEVVWETALARLVEGKVPRGGLILDVGIGSGSYGGRLAARGWNVTGVDVNETMLAAAKGRWTKLQRRLVQADAAQLPIRNGSVAAVVVAQMLHLVTNWQAALAESIRVLRRDGILALSRGGGVGRSGIGEYFRSVVGKVPQLPGAMSREEIFDAVAVLGGELLETISIQGEAQQSRREFIDRLKNNPFAWHPDIDQERLATAAELTRADVVERGLDLDEPLPTPAGLTFDVFRVRGC